MGNTIKLNVKEEGLQLVKNYYIDGKPGKPGLTTKMVHKDYVDSQGNFPKSKLIKC